MLKIRRPLLKNPSQRACIWPLLIALTIFTVSGASQLATPDLGFSYSKDKLAHFLVFGLLATSILRIPFFRSSEWKGALIVVLLTSAFGAGDEFRQSFTPNRSVEFDDWIADTLGAGVAALVYLRWHGYRKLLEWRPKK